MKTANENFENFPNAHVKSERYHMYYSDTPLELYSGRLIYSVNGKSTVFSKSVNKWSSDSGNFYGKPNYLYYKGPQPLYRYKDCK